MTVACLTAAGVDCVPYTDSSVDYITFCTLCFFFFKQKTAYEMRISDWSSDVCSSDLFRRLQRGALQIDGRNLGIRRSRRRRNGRRRSGQGRDLLRLGSSLGLGSEPRLFGSLGRSEEHTSELQSLMRISYAVFCLKKNNNTTTQHTNYTQCQYSITAI